MHYWKLKIDRVGNKLNECWKLHVYKWPDGICQGFHKSLRKAGVVERWIPPYCQIWGIVRFRKVIDLPAARNKQLWSFAGKRYRHTGEPQALHPSDLLQTVLEPGEAFEPLSCRRKRGWRNEGWESDWQLAPRTVHNPIDISSRQSQAFPRGRVIWPEPDRSHPCQKRFW